MIPVEVDTTELLEIMRLEDVTGSLLIDDIFEVFVLCEKLNELSEELSS